MGNDTFSKSLELRRVYFPFPKGINMHRVVNELTEMPSKRSAKGWNVQHEPANTLQLDFRPTSAAQFSSLLDLSKVTLQQAELSVIPDAEIFEQHLGTQQCLAKKTKLCKDSS